jgi:sulfotransferase
MKKNKMYFLSGLPRSGSTLLSAILSENKEIHAEGNSAVCQLMWDMKISCDTSSHEQLLANNRQKTKNDLISSIPSIYYKDVSRPYILDKCRSWTIPDNLDMIKKYITENPKIIVLTRPVNDIIDSFSQLRKRNLKNSDTSDLLIEGSDPLMRSLYGVEFAKKNNNGEFIFIEYDNLIDNTEEIINLIYDFCEWEPFKHNLKNIINRYPENDNVYGLLGMHDVRPQIGRRKNIL